MPITLYGTVFSPPTRNVLITAEAIGLTLELKGVDLGKREHFAPEFLQINPQHTIPTLDDNGLLVVDSHAIIAYLVSKYGKDDTLYPKDLAKRSLVDARLHFDSGHAFSVLKNIYKAHLYEGQTEYLSTLQIQKITEVYDLVNTLLGRTRWIAADVLTIADIPLVTTINSLECMLAIDVSKYPNVRKWSDAANALPFFSVNKTGNKEYKAKWDVVSSKH